MPNVELSAREFFEKHSRKTVSAMDESGKEVTGRLLSISWRDSFGLKLTSGERIQVEYDPKSVRVH